MNSIIEVFERLGRIEWYSIRPAHLATGTNDTESCFPIVSLRYEGGNREQHAAILQALKDFPNGQRWRISSSSEKNITVAPIAIFAGDIPSLRMSEELVGTAPGLADEARRDFDELILFFEGRFNGMSACFEPLSSPSEPDTN